MAGQTATTSAVVGYAYDFVDTIPKELQTECSDIDIALRLTVTATILSLESIAM